MLEFFTKLFAVDFMPHVYCLRLADVIWLHIASDGLIAVAYFLIPVAITLLVRRRKDLEFSGLFILFGCFILACAATHVLNIVTLWYPVYRLDGVVKAITAVASIFTAIALFRLLPQAVALPSPSRLRQEIRERLIAEANLRELNATLEKRVDERAHDLARSNARFQAAARAVGDVLWTNDSNGEMKGDQSGWAAITGQSAEEYKGYGWSRAVHPDDAGPTIDAWRRAVAVRSNFVFEHRVRRQDGVWRTFSIKAVPVLDDFGEILEWVGVHHDITDDRVREADLRTAKLAAEAANRAKSGFLANMSHELRTPLNAIIGYSELLTEEASTRKDAELVSDLNRIRSAGRHLLSLIDSVLDLSKIEAGKMELFVESIDVGPFLNDVKSIVDPLAKLNANRFEFHVDPLLSKLVADHTKLRQVLLNLLSNACKFTSAGLVELRATLGEQGRAVFQVSDTGIGLTSDQLQYIFEPFTQADSSTTRNFGGSGLGLTLSRHFVEMMGGTLIGESAIGKGSTFTLSIPASVGFDTSVGSHPYRVEASK